MTEVLWYINGSITSYDWDVQRQPTTQLILVYFIDGIDLDHAQVLQRASFDVVIIDNFIPYGLEASWQHFPFVN